MDLRISEKYPAAGEGAFAKEDVPAMTIFSLYGGLVLTKEEADEMKVETDKVHRAKKLTVRDPEFIESWKYRYRIIHGRFLRLSAAKGKIHKAFPGRCH